MAAHHRANKKTLETVYGSTCCSSTRFYDTMKPGPTQLNSLLGSPRNVAKASNPP